MALVEDEAVRAVERDRDALHLASLIGVAMVKPALLEQEEARLHARARTLLTGSTETSPAHAERMRAQARALIDRIQRSGALSDLRAN